LACLAAVPSGLRSDYSPAANDPFRFLAIIQRATSTHFPFTRRDRANKENRRFPMTSQVVRFSRAPEVVLSLSFIGIVFAYIAASSALA
jgi:hypothetical protein